MSIVYELLVENKIHNNMNTVKSMYNSFLRESKQDLALFKNEFKTLNETTNVDDTDLRQGFRQIAESLRKAKSLIEYAEGVDSLSKRQEAVKKAHKIVQEGLELRERLMESFSDTVSKAEKIFESIK